MHNLFTFCRIISYFEVIAAAHVLANIFFEKYQQRFSMGDTLHTKQTNKQNPSSDLKQKYLRFCDL